MLAGAASLAGLAANSVVVTAAPTSQSASDLPSSHVFSSVIVTVIGGTASSYTWSFTNILGGSWSLFSGAGTAIATPQVASVAGIATATLVCDVVVNGITYSVSCALSYEKV